ncbi:MAG: hypothetical protein ACOVJ4_05725, partial [Sphingobacteriaceae bacterium]
IRFDIFKSLSKKFDIYSKIVFRDAENYFLHLAELVLHHPMQVWNYFVNSFYSAPLGPGGGSHLLGGRGRSLGGPDSDEETETLVLYVNYDQWWA